MVDIDHFKRYNDHYGHVSGDACLQQIAQVMQGAARRSGDLVARYGGEEFALLLPSTDAPATFAVAQRCVELVRQAQYPHAGSPTASHMSISVGVAGCVPEGQREPSVLTLAADAALYRAKEPGRNRACAAAPLVA